MNYTIKQSGYYTGNGCDCCPDDYWETYEVYNDKGEDMNIKVSTIEDAFTRILQLHGMGVKIEYTEE